MSDATEEMPLFAFRGRQPTSDWAWDKVEAMLPKARAMVYRVIAEKPRTAGEITIVMPPRGNPSWHRRLEELEALGVARRTRIRPCFVTGEKAWEWDIVPGAWPTTIPKRRTMIEEIASRLCDVQTTLTGPEAGQLVIDWAAEMRQRGRKP